jgi:PleD family two-component response regulator
VSESWILIDEATGLHVGWYFWLRVLDEVNRASRYGEPFGLLLLDLDAGGDATRRDIDEAGTQVPGAIRGTDLGGTLGPGRVGVLLVHQDARSAELARERILGRLDKACGPNIRWSPRLYVYPDDGAEISNLLTAGWAERQAPGPAGERLPA